MVWQALNQETNSGEVLVMAVIVLFLCSFDVLILPDRFAEVKAFLEIERYSGMRSPPWNLSLQRAVALQWYEYRFPAHGR